MNTRPNSPRILSTHDPTPGGDRITCGAGGSLILDSLPTSTQDRSGF